MNTVHVVGSLNMDIVATAERLPVPGETLFASQVAYFPGGKGANQAVASAQMGVPTELLGKIGHDGFGAALTGFLERWGLERKLVVSHKEPTGTAMVTVGRERGENTIVVVSGANGELTAHDLMGMKVARGDVVVSQFEVPLPAIVRAFEIARAAGALTVLNPAPVSTVTSTLRGLTDVIVLNETEFAVVSGRRLEVEDEDNLLAGLRSFQTGSQVVVLTMGRRGVIAWDGREAHRYHGHAVDAVDSTGAGDCFVGVLAAQLARGEVLGDALAFANHAAALSVTRPGAAPAMPTHAEVLGFLSRSTSLT